MVQTIAVSEAALNDNMFNFLLEDANALGPEANWWHPRVKLVEQWLKDEANRAGMPDDGSEEMIRRHMQRGDIYPHVQLKCWKHILLEMQDLPCFATRYADLSSTRSVNTSPSRGKIRPGKELIILSNDREFRANNEGDEPPLSEESDLGTPSQSAASDSSAGAAGSTSGTATKKFSSLSMAERQAEWLRKKQEKMEAERSRQEEEKEKELTFQPKILRRATLGDKPTKDSISTSITTTAQPPRVLQRSDTGGGGAGSNSRKLDTSGASEPSSKPSAGLKEKAIPRVPPRSAGRRKKPQSSVPVSQAIEISSDLLESMKSELMVSISKRTSQSPAKTAAIIENDDESSAIEGIEAATENPEAAQPTDDQLLLPLKSWSDQPMIGGRRIDFDSSETKARLVLQDAAKFELSTMYRKTDKKAKRDGVALHMGRREDNFEEEVIAVLFDKEKVSELEAVRWWCEHEHRFTQFMRVCKISKSRDLRATFQNFFVASSSKSEIKQPPCNIPMDLVASPSQFHPHFTKQQAAIKRESERETNAARVRPSSPPISGSSAMGQRLTTERGSSFSSNKEEEMEHTEGRTAAATGSFPLFSTPSSMQQDDENNANKRTHEQLSVDSTSSAGDEQHTDAASASAADRASSFMSSAFGRTSSSGSSIMAKLFSAKRPSLPDISPPVSSGSTEPPPVPVDEESPGLHYGGDPFAEERFVSSPHSSSSRTSSVVMSPRTFEALDAEFKPPTLSRFRSVATGNSLSRTDSKARIARIQSKQSSHSSSDSSLDSDSSSDDDVVQDDEIEVNDWLDEPEDAIFSPKQRENADRNSSFSSSTSTLHGAHSSSSLTGGPTAGRASVTSSSNSITALATWLSSPDDQDDDLEDDDEPVLTPFMQENMPVYEVMKQVQLFRNLSQNQQEQVVRALKPTKFQDGEIIVQQGTRGSRFYMIAKGNAVVTKTTKNGSQEQERMVTHLHAGHYFGELALIYDDPRTATVRAIGDVELLYLTQEDFQRIGQVHLSLMLQQVPLLARLSAHDQDIVLSRLKPANFNDGEYIVCQGEEGTRFYMITRGEAVVSERATTTITKADGSTITKHYEKELTRLYEGHVFGEMSLIYSEPRTASVRAIGPVKCLYLTKEDFDKCQTSDSFQRFINEAYVEKATRRAMRLRLQQRASTTGGKEAGGAASPSTPALTVNADPNMPTVIPPPAPTSPVKATETRKLVKQRLKNGQKVVNKYIIKGDLGKGTFGRVKLCQSEEDNNLYAVKIMHKTFVQRMAGKEDQLQDVLRREVAIMKKLNHRNVVKLVEVIDDPSSEKMYLVQEYVQHNLMDEVTRTNGLNEEVARKYMRDLLSGLHYLHFHKVIHRDIKPENILVSKEGVAKIADFGTARMIMNESETLSGAKGTPAFMAPEMFNIDATYTGPSVDVWSLGATLYMMVIGRPPWLADNEIVLAEKVQRDELKFPKESERTMEPHLKNLIQRMLTKDPSLRLTLNDCFNHDWITKEGSEPLGLAEKENDLTVSLDESERAIQNIPERIDLSLAGSLERAHLLVKTRQQGGITGGVVRTSSGHSLGLGTPVSGQLENRIPTSTSIASTSSSSTTSPGRSSTEEVSRVINAWRHHKRVHLMDGHKELSARSRELLLEQKRMAFSVDRAKVTEIILPAAGPSARSRYPSSSSVSTNQTSQASGSNMSTSNNSSGSSTPTSPRHQSSPSMVATITSRNNSVEQNPLLLLKKRSSGRMIKDPDTGNLEGFGRTSFTSVTRLSDGLYATTAGGDDLNSVRDRNSDSFSSSSENGSVGDARGQATTDLDLMKRSLSRKKDFLMVTSEVFRDEDGDYQSRKILFQARDDDFSVASRVPIHTKSGRELGRASSSQTKSSSRKSIGSSPFNNSGGSLGSNGSGSSSKKSSAHGGGGGLDSSSVDEFNMDDLDCVQVTEVDDEDDDEDDEDDHHGRKGHGRSRRGTTDTNDGQEQLRRDTSHGSGHSASDSDSDESIYSDVEGDVDVDATFNDLIGTPGNLDIVPDDDELAPLEPPSRGSSASNLLDFQAQRIVQVYVSSKIRENLTLRIRSGYAEAKMSRSYMEDKSTGIAECALGQYGPQVAQEFASLGFFGVYDGHNGEDTAMWLQKELHHRFFSHPDFVDAPLSAIASICDTIDHEILDAQNRSVLPKRKRTIVGAEFGFADDDDNVGDDDDDDDDEEEVEEISDVNEMTCHLQPISFSGAVSVFAVLAKRKKRRLTEEDKAPVADETMAAAEEEEEQKNEDKKEDKDDEEPPTTLYIANVGDCRAVLCTTDGLAVELTKDHKAALPEEKARIEASGGFVHNGRLDGILAISRGFGDLAHKQDGHLIATPDIYERVVNDEDEFLLLASDGLFDVLSSQQCVNFIRRKLLTHGDVQLAAQEILLKAQQYFAHDNISVIIVALNQDASALLN